MPSPSSSLNTKDSRDSNDSTISHEHNWNQARQEFRKAVHTAVDDLVRQQGFSRARATQTIVQYMTVETATTAVTTSPPSDAEVFAFMQRHGLGHQQAVLAMAVSSIMQEKCTATTTTGDWSDMVKGLRRLTLVVQGLADAEPTAFHQAQEDPTTTTQGVTIPWLKLTNRHNESAFGKGQKARMSTTTSCNSNRMNQPTKNYIPPRKRGTPAVQETVEHQELQSKRLRANSLSEEVNAKVEEAEAAAASSTATRSTAATDGKKAIVLGTKAATTPNTRRSKRSRNNNTTATTEETEHVTTTGATGKRRKTSAK